MHVEVDVDVDVYVTRATAHVDVVSLELCFPPPSVCVSVWCYSPPGSCAPV